VNDLVLIDFFMPEMTCRGLAAEIRADQKLKDLKLAFLTVASFGEVGREDLHKRGSWTTSRSFSIMRTWSEGKADGWGINFALGRL